MKVCFTAKDHSEMRGAALNIYEIFEHLFWLMKENPKKKYLLQVVEIDE